jgi:hypothetical protein
MYRVYESASWFVGSVAVALLAISLVLAPQARVVADSGGPDGGGTKCFGINCQTQDCFRTGRNMCNKTGNECMQTKNPPLCGACICTPHDPDPCLCQ